MTPTTIACHPAMKTTAANDTSNMIEIWMKVTIHIGRESSIASISVVQRDTMRASGTVSNHLRSIVIAGQRIYEGMKTTYRRGARNMLWRSLLWITRAALTEPKTKQTEVPPWIRYEQKTMVT